MTHSENRDPVVNVMGPAYAKVSSTDSDSILQAHADIAKAREDGAENVEELENRFRLVLLINNIDMALLQSSVETIAKYVTNFYSSTFSFPLYVYYVSLSLTPAPHCTPIPTPLAILPTRGSYLVDLWPLSEFSSLLPWGVGSGFPTVME